MMGSLLWTYKGQPISLHKLLCVLCVYNGTTQSTSNSSTRGWFGNLIITSHFEAGGCWYNKVFEFEFEQEHCNHYNHYGDNLVFIGCTGCWPGTDIELCTNAQVKSILMGYCKKDVTPLLTHWSYVFLTLTHRYHLQACNFSHLNSWLSECFVK